LLVIFSIGKLFWGFKNKLTQKTDSSILIQSIPFLGAFVYDEDSYYYHYFLKLNSVDSVRERKVDLDFLREASYIPWTSHLALYHAVATIDSKRALSTVAFYACRTSNNTKSIELIAKRVGNKDEIIGSTNAGKIDCR